VSAATPGEVFAFAGFSLDARQRLLFGANGEPIPVTARAFDTLLYLVEHPDELIDKRTLMKAVWPSQIVEENNLNQTISIVRRALGETPGEHRFIVTVPGRGFRFVAAVGREERVGQAPALGGAAGSASPIEPPKEPYPPAAGPAGDRRQASPRRLWTLLLVLALGGMGGVAVAFWLFSRPHGVSEERPASVRASESAATVAATASASVAVVPFANLTGDATKEYFSDGMAEELINELTRVPGLKVPARTSSFAYKGRNIDVRQIARDLGVKTILEGSVRSAGDRIRVTAQLVNAESGFHFWSQSYDRNFGDVFKLEDEISAQIVEALKRTMNAELPSAAGQPPPAAATQAVPTKDPEAYRLFLQGNASPGVVGIPLFTQAILKDPGFARAYAARAWARVIVAAFGALTPGAVTEAERDAKQALMLDPSLAVAHEALGTVKAWQGDWLAAESSYERARQLDPGDADIYATHATLVLTSSGHQRQLEQDSLVAVGLAPATMRFAALLAEVYDQMGRTADALHYRDRAIALGGDNDILVRVVTTSAAIRGGHYDEAAEQSVSRQSPAMRAAGGDVVIRQVFAAVGNSGDRGAASKALRALLQRVRVSAPNELHKEDALIWATLLGDLDLAYDSANWCLEQFARLGTVGTTWGFLWQPEMRPFRLDPRFQALVARLKLFDYWEQYGPPDGCDLVGDRLVCR
jgi:TolB-like protein/DNA-binding winged helix-turn-helix (wHTH) protein